MKKNTSDTEQEDNLPEVQGQHSRGHGRRGRRRGSPDTRYTILKSARGIFAELGYDKASMRCIAKHADVDPALVLYFFDSKDNLFHEAIVQALRFLIPPRSVFSAGPDLIAERLLEHVLSQWESPLSRDTLMAVMRSAVSHEMAALELRKFFETNLLPHLRESVRKPDPALRSTLVSSQLAGLMMMRYVVRMHPLASMETSEVVSFVAPTLQHYITGDL